MTENSILFDWLTFIFEIQNPINIYGIHSINIQVWQVIFIQIIEKLDNLIFQCKYLQSNYQQDDVQNMDPTLVFDFTQVDWCWIAGVIQLS